MISTIQKRRCTSHTPLNITGTSRRRCLLIADDQIIDSDIECLYQFLDNILSRHMPAYFYVSDGTGRYLGPSRKFVYGQTPFQSPVLQSYSQMDFVAVHWSSPLSLWVNRAFKGNISAKSVQNQGNHDNLFSLLLKSFRNTLTLL